MQEVFTLKQSYSCGQQKEFYTVPRFLLRSFLQKQFELLLASVSLSNLRMRYTTGNPSSETLELEVCCASVSIQGF